MRIIVVGLRFNRWYWSARKKICSKEYMVLSISFSTKIDHSYLQNTLFRDPSLTRTQPVNKIFNQFLNYCIGFLWFSKKHANFLIFCRAPFTGYRILKSGSPLLDVGRDRKLIYVIVGKLGLRL